MKFCLYCKKELLKRDKYSCKICGEKQGDRVHAVHHIDYNKENCNPNNLIIFCISCHSKTNYNRKYWINFFTSYEQILNS